MISIHIYEFNMLIYLGIYNAFDVPTHPASDKPNFSTYYIH